MDDTERALVAGICAAPADDTARLVYADYLDERERGAEADFIRVQMTLADAANHARPDWADEGARLRKEEQSLLTHLCCKVAPAWWRLLLDTIPGVSLCVPLSVHSSMKFPATIRRGFVESLTLTAESFLRNADALVWNPKSDYDCRTGIVGDDNVIVHVGCPVCGGSGRVPRPCPETAQPITKVKLTPRPFPIELGNVPHNPDALKQWLAGKWPDVEFELPPDFSYLTDTIGGGNPPILTVEYVAAGDGFLPAEGWLIEPIADEFDATSIPAGKKPLAYKGSERRYSLSLTYPLADAGPTDAFGVSSGIPVAGDTFGPVTAMTLSRQATITVARAVVENVELFPDHYRQYRSGLRVRAVVIGDTSPPRPA